MNDSEPILVTILKIFGNTMLVLIPFILHIAAMSAIIVSQIFSLVLSSSMKRFESDEPNETKPSDEI